MSEEMILRKEMCGSHLIQRIEKPYGVPSDIDFSNTISVDGLSTEAKTILKTIYRFDYMGSAEFEFGAIPTAFRFMAKQAHAKNLVAGSVGNVYYITPKPYEQEVKVRIERLRQDEYSFRLKEWCGLKDALLPTKESFGSKSIGWFEIDNGFMFFVDKEMFENSCNLFGIKVKQLPHETAISLIF